MGTARHLLSPTQAVTSLIPTGLQGQLAAVLDAQVAGAEIQQLPLCCLEELPACFPTFQGGASRDEPSHIGGTQTKHSFDVPTELRVDPGVVHLANRVDGSLVVGHGRLR